MTQVVVTGDGTYWGLKVTVDGVDVSNQMVSTGQNRHEGKLSLAAGTHTITASAEVYCQNCSGGKTQSTDTNTFVVASPSTQVCARPSGGPSVITLDAGVIAVAQQPGRKLIAYQMANQWDTLLIIVDDAPDLQQNQMRVEFDIDPMRGVTWNKAIEAWGFCHSGSRVDLVEASWVGGVGTGAACWEISEDHDYRSGCTDTQTMLVNQSTTSELWLRKPGMWGIWADLEGIDSSIWQAFGGRSVRFLWRQD